MRAKGTTVLYNAFSLTVPRPTCLGDNFSKHANAKPAKVTVTDVLHFNNAQIYCKKNCCPIHLPGFVVRIHQERT